MRSRLHRVLGASAWLIALLGARVAFGQEVEVVLEAEAASGLNSGDNAWVLMSSAIVLMMTIPGLALFYGGLVRGKNVLSILMLCFVTAAVVSVTWVLWGYSIAFGGSGPIWGGIEKLALQGVSWNAGPDENIPEQTFMVFQLMFAIITPALIVGAIAERMKFSAFLLFVIAWSTLIYAPLAHWVWGEGGWIGARGALDFAGGTVVHISSGTSALVAAAMIGRRRGFGRDPMPPHNVPFVVIGAALLWVGWFGFNAGSALAADGIASIAFVNTNTATGAAVLGWMCSEWIGKGKPTAVGAATGAVAGLVAITPAAGFVEPAASIAIGAIAGFLCYKACNWKNKVGYDDALDVVGVHGVGGTWGAIATGIFASPALSDGGLIWGGNAGQVWTQIVGIGATYVLCLVGTVVILGLVNSVVGLRVDDEDEAIGLDLSQHAESAYSTGGAGSPIGERPVHRERVIVQTATPAGAVGGGSRVPPLRPPVQREAPRSAAPPVTPPAAAAAPSRNGSASNKPFRVVVGGLEPNTLARWWRDLCTQDHSKAPQAFRDIYPNVRSFEGTSFHFRGGDPKLTRDQLAQLLDMYGAHASEVRIEDV
ncbi:MAG: ammonium transporter [Deltaproteobacteria bacterium]|nr:MAG: ammonium transporter [Deltaproteobacteria bacterium]